MFPVFPVAIDTWVYGPVPMPSFYYMLFLFYDIKQPINVHVSPAITGRYWPSLRSKQISSGTKTSENEELRGYGV